MLNEDIEGKLYSLNGYGSDFYTGRIGDGRQALMGLLCPELVTFFFSPDGALIGREARPWDYPAPQFHGDGPYQIYDAEFRRRLEEQMSGWKSALGFEAQTIGVQAFFDREYYVGVEELPGPEEEEDWEGEAEVLEAWREQGVFTFYWAKDYIMSADGEVEST